MLKAEVIEYFGGKQVDVVKALKQHYPISKSTVSLWQERIPENWSAKLHVLTDGKLRHDLTEYR